MPDCIFCKIVTGEFKTKFLFEDEKIVAFKDINPAAPLHILIVPKNHIENILDLDDNSIMVSVLNAVKKLSRKYNIDEKGFRIVVNCKDDGGQTVNHLHFHLLGGRRMTWPPG